MINHAYSGKNERRVIANNLVQVDFVCVSTDVCTFASRCNSIRLRHSEWKFI